MHAVRNILGSMRYWTHQRQATYATGSQYLIRNDVPLPPPTKPEILTDRQTNEAIRVIQQQVKNHRSFFLNLWFDAPHSPWEAIEPFFTQYNGKFNTERLQKYASMISNMDMNIGRLLDVLDQTGANENSLIMFTSDNGPENEAGSTGKFKGQKRLLTEGGIRVPAMASWRGYIPANSLSDKYVVGTDIYPTLIHAAGIRMPGHIRIDGISMLPMLTQPTSLTAGDERIVLYFSHSVGFPKLASVQAHGYKLLWNDYEGRKGNKLPPALRLFDMRIDQYEDINLIPLILEHCGKNEFEQSINTSYVEVSMLPRGGVNSYIDNSVAIKVLIQFVSHLHLLLHVFKYIGDRDWIEYHNNKIHANEASCAVRSIDNSTFLTFTNPIISPSFCGSDLMNEMFALCGSSSHSCSCSFDSLINSGLSGQRSLTCADGWTKSDFNGWSSGPIFSHLLNFSHASDGFVQHINQLLEVSKYKSICKFHEDNALSKFTKNIQPVPIINSIPSSSQSSNNNCYYTVANKSVLPNGSWTSTNLQSIGMNDMKDKTTLLSSCHQRLHLRSYSSTKSLDSLSTGTYSLLSYHMSTNTCGSEATVTVVNHAGMPYPIYICPSSLYKLSAHAVAGQLLGGKNTHFNSQSNLDTLPYFDDDMMMATIYDLLSSPHKLSEHFANSLYNIQTTSSSKAPIEKSARGLDHSRLSDIELKEYAHSVGVIDALFYRVAQLKLLGSLTDNTLKPAVPKSLSAKISLTNEFLKLSTTEMKTFATSQIRYMLPFYSHLLHRASGTSIYRLSQLVIPILDNERWSVALVYGDISTLLNTTSASASASELVYIYYDPTGSAHDMMSERRKELIGSLIEAMLTYFCGGHCQPLSRLSSHYFVDSERSGAHSSNKEEEKVNAIRIAALSGSKIISFLSSFATEAMRCKLEAKHKKSDLAIQTCFLVNNLRIKFPKPGKLLKKARMIAESFVLEGQKQHYQLTKYLNYMTTDKYK